MLNLVLLASFPTQQQQISGGFQDAAFAAPQAQQQPAHQQPVPQPQQQPQQQQQSQMVYSLFVWFHGTVDSYQNYRCLAWKPVESAMPAVDSLLTWIHWAQANPSPMWIKRISLVN